MLLTRIKYLIFVILLTSGENQFSDNVLYMFTQISNRCDEIWLNLTEMDGRIGALEKRMGENQTTNNETSNAEDGLREDFNIMMRAFDVEKKEILEKFVELMDKTMETTMNVCNETGTELKQKISQFENEKADNGRVNTVKMTLNLVQSSTDDLRNRTELVQTKITGEQDFSSFGSRLDNIETNVSTVMETMKKKVSFSAQLRIQNSNYTQLSKNKTIRFNHVFYNDGGGFNATSGEFTVPQSGVYIFIFFVESYQPTDDKTCLGAFVKLYVDGVYAEMSAIADPNYEQHIQAGNSYINYFDKGQRVLIQTADLEKCQASYIGGTSTTFSGLLLY